LKVPAEQVCHNHIKLTQKAEPGSYFPVCPRVNSLNIQNARSSQIILAYNRSPKKTKTSARWT